MAEMNNNADGESNTTKTTTSDSDLHQELKEKCQVRNPLETPGHKELGRLLARLCLSYLKISFCLLICLLS